MQKHVELDEPEEAHELELDTALFGSLRARRGARGRDRRSGRGPGEEEAVIEEEASKRSWPKIFLGWRRRLISGWSRARFAWDFDEDCNPEPQPAWGAAPLMQTLLPTRRAGAASEAKGGNLA